MRHPPHSAEGVETGFSPQLLNRLPSIQTWKDYKGKRLSHVTHEQILTVRDRTLLWKDFHETRPMRV